MTAEVRPAPFFLALEREFQDARKGLLAALRLIEQARATNGDSRILDLAHLVASYGAEDVEEILRDLAPFIRTESTPPAVDVLEGD